MMNHKKIVKYLFYRTGPGKKLISLFLLVPYLIKKGWFLSRAKEVPVDEFDNPIPWYTYPAISFLTSRVHRGMRVFEYGSGNSTLWWASKVASVVSCEHDVDWHDRMLGILPPNVDYNQCDLKDSYTNFINKFNAEFDCIVIDGRERVNCTLNSIHALRGCLESN